MRVIPHRLPLRVARRDLDAHCVADQDGVGHGHAAIVPFGVANVAVVNVHPTDTDDP